MIEAGEIRRFPDLASAYRMDARLAHAGDPVQVRRYAMFEAAKYALDLTEEDFKQLKKLLPEYVRKNPTYAVLPWKSPEGNLQWVNLGYYFPWSTHVELARGGCRTPQ